MIGRVTKNPITNCCYAETLAGPTGGTVQKLGLCADCDYEVVLSAGDRDVDGESYVGVSTCCPVTYNPETGVFCVCTLQAGNVCGDIDATKVIEQGYTCASCSYPLPMLGCITCTGDVCSACVYTSPNLSFCPYNNTLFANYVCGMATVSCMDRVTACICTAEKFGYILPMSTSVCYLNGASFVAACPYVYSRSTSLCAGPSYYPRVSNCCGVYAESVHANTLCRSNCCYIGLCADLMSKCNITGNIVGVNSLHWGCWGLVDGCLRVCSCGSLSGALYSADDDYGYNDIYMGIDLTEGRSPICLCANCFCGEDNDICLNLGVTNGMVYPDDGFECYCTDSFCQNFFIGGRNIIHTNDGCGGRCNILLGMDNHLFAQKAEYEECGWNIVSGIRNNIGSCWQVASCNIYANCNSVYGMNNCFPQTCIFVDNVVVGSYNSTSNCTWQNCTCCNVIIGNRNYLCGCNSVTIQDDHVIIGHRNVDCTACGSIMIGNHNYGCGVRDSILIGGCSMVCGIGGGIVIGHCACVAGLCAIATGFCAKATGTGSVALGYMSCTYCNGAIAIGHGAHATNICGLAIGMGAQAKQVYCTCYSMVTTRAMGGIMDVAINSSISEACLWSALCCMFTDAWGPSNQSWYRMGTMIRSYCATSNGDPGVRWCSVAGESLYICGSNVACLLIKCGCPFRWGSLSIRKGCSALMCAQSGWGCSSSTVYATLHY